MVAGRRLILAFAISIALHEVVAGAIPPGPSQVTLTETVTSARILRVTRHATTRAATTPAPPPTATPRAVAAAKHLPIVPVARAAALPRRALGAHAAHIKPDARPVWDTALGVSSSGAATTTAFAAGAGAAGSQGHGTAALGGEPPCGFVSFSDPHGSHFDMQTRGFWVDIRMSVHFADGSAQSVMLDYPWYYPSEAANPWSDQNLKDPNFPTRFQPPPADRVSGEPPLVQYVAQHSTPDGMTLLRDCPAAAASSR